MYDKWLDTLKTVALFYNIESSELNRMLLCLHPSIANYKKKEIITIAGSEFSGIGILVEGEVVVTKENFAGDRIIISKLKSGQMFGEIIAFSNQNKWPATVIASTNCTILFLPTEKIIGNCPNMCIGHKTLIQNMLKIVSQKALKLNKKIDYLSMKNLRTKICNYLLEFYRKHQSNQFIIPLNRSELAEFLNVSRPSLSRELMKMKDDNLIDYDRNAFKLLSIEKIKSICSTIDN
jgi:CRP-like cAMP-binding protein